MYTDLSVLAFDCGWADNEARALAINISFIMYLQMCASELLLHWELCMPYSDGHVCW